MDGTIWEMTELSLHERTLFDVMTNFSIDSIIHFTSNRNDNIFCIVMHKYIKLNRTRWSTKEKKNWKFMIAIDLQDKWFFFALKWTFYFVYGFVLWKFSENPWIQYGDRVMGLTCVTVHLFTDRQLVFNWMELVWSCEQTARMEKPWAEWMWGFH